MPPDLRIAAVRTVWAAGYGRRAGKPDQNDAGRIRNHPAHRSARLHTGGMCHLDADMSRQGMAALEAEADNALDFIILENVGNLVCPAEFDTVACLNVAILSVPEGDDKPLKYPLMFEKCQVVIINKIDSMPAFDFDMDRVKNNIAMRNPEAVVFPISARTGEGMDAWCEWLKDNAAQYLGENQNG